LQTLITDSILVLKGTHYHLKPDQASELIGLSWQDLRRGIASKKLIAYLERFIKDHKDLFDA
jgi:hypothetical protein